MKQYKEFKKKVTLKERMNRWMLLECQAPEVKAHLEQIGFQRK